MLFFGWLKERERSQGRQSLGWRFCGSKILPRTLDGVTRITLILEGQGNLPLWLTPSVGEPAVAGGGKAPFSIKGGPKNIRMTYGKTKTEVERYEGRDGKYKGVGADITGSVPVLPFSPSLKLSVCLSEKVTVA